MRVHRLHTPAVTVMYAVRHQDGRYACTAPPGPVQAAHWGFEWKAMVFFNPQTCTHAAPPGMMTWQTKKGAERFAGMNGGKVKDLDHVFELAKTERLEPLRRLTAPRQLPINDYSQVVKLKVEQCKPRNTALYGLLPG